MINYFSAAVLLLTVDAAAVTDMQSIIRKQAQPPLELQTVQINDQGDSSLMQKSVSAQPDYGYGDGDGDGDSAGSDNVCSTNKAFDPASGGGKSWKGKCKSFAECQALCTGDCTGFNWWPDKGGCRTNTGAYNKRDVTFVTLGGDATCTPPDASPTTPLCSECSSLTGDACTAAPVTAAPVTAAPVTAAPDASVCTTAVMGATCTTRVKFLSEPATETCVGGTQQWKGRCKTLAECQAECTGDCTGFEWWPGKGGCRTHTGPYTLHEVDYEANIAGLGCTYSGAVVTTPTDAVCS